MKKMRVLAIDQALTGWCGYALSTGIAEANDMDTQLLFWDVEDYRGIKNKQENVIRFGENFIKYVNLWEPTHVIMEEIRLYSGGIANVFTITALGMLQGVALYVKPPTIPLYVVDTGAWKRALLPKGETDKAASVQYVYKEFGMVLDDHQADAICMSLYPFKKEPDETIKARRKTKGGIHRDTWRKIA